MSGQKINIIIFNANYYGTMASAMRVRNLFDSLTLSPNIILNNLVINGSDVKEGDELLNVQFKNLIYNFKNPFSIILFYFKSFYFLIQQKRQKIKNILYCYGYPSLENIHILVFAKLLQIDIVFDIVEDENLIEEIRSRSIRSQINNYFVKKMQFLIPILGSICFAISTQLIELCKKLCKNKIPVHHLPISVNIESISKYKKPILKDKISIFYGGSFGYKDGLGFLLDGFEKAYYENNNLELILTGKGNALDEKIITDRIKRSSCNTNIKFLGCLPICEYYKAMVNSDILCMTRVNSKYANSGFPFKIGEYLASGNAIITTNVGDINKYLLNKKNALIIEPNSAIQVAKSILKLADDSELRIKLGFEGSIVAKQHFNSKIVSDKLINIISNLA